jgi:hypothetical protein
VDGLTNNAIKGQFVRQCEALRGDFGGEGDNASVMAPQMLWSSADIAVARGIGGHIPPVPQAGIRLVSLDHRIGDGQ